MYKKKKILDIEAVYTAHAFQNESGFYIGAGSETKDEASLYNMLNGEISPIPRQPGGMREFLPVPGNPDLFISIMGFFPDFNGQDAGIFLHTRMETNWESGKALALPFVHRCRTLSLEGRHFLIAATSGKPGDKAGDSPEPGEVHVIDLEHCEIKRWRSTVIDDSINRIHGICKTLINGTETVCISGDQGIFYIEYDGENWRVNQIFFREVSEMGFADLDGDGRDELVTIEPYHGNTLNIYKKDGANWVPRFSAELTLGHGLSAGIFRSEPTIVVGNRSGSMALESFVVSDLLRGNVERRIIEESAGAVRSQVFTFDSVDYILSANHRRNEVALYT